MLNTCVGVYISDSLLFDQPHIISTAPTAPTEKEINQSSFLCITYNNLELYHNT